MDINYIVLLDCSVGEVIKIRLSAEEKIESEKYEDFSEFIETLEDKYGFNLGYCSWMSCEVLSERSYLLIQAMHLHELFAVEFPWLL